MNRHRSPHDHPSAGVTLVEVLVVLVLIGILASVVGLSLGGTGRFAGADREADLLVARLNRAADEVLLTAQDMAMSWDRQSYRFFVREDDAWVPHPVPVLNALHVLPGDLRFDEAGSITVGPDMRPRDGEILTLRLRTDGNEGTLHFDGLNATRLAATR